MSLLGLKRLTTILTLHKFHVPRASATRYLYIKEENYLPF